jgi:hypothetical protein
MAGQISASYQQAFHAARVSDKEGRKEFFTSKVFLHPELPARTTERASSRKGFPHPEFSM